MTNKITTPRGLINFKLILSESAMRIDVLCVTLGQYFSDKAVFEF